MRRVVWRGDGADELAQLCRQTMREEPGFAALVLQRAADDAANGEQQIVPQAEAKSDVVAVVSCLAR